MSQKPQQPNVQTFEIDPRTGPPAYIVGLRREVRMAEGGPISSEPTRHPYVCLDILPGPLKRSVTEIVRAYADRGPT
jgi:hypothetical protein